MNDLDLDFDLWGSLYPGGYKLPQRSLLIGKEHHEQYI